MATPTPARPQYPRSGNAVRWIRWAVVGFVLVMVACRWAPHTGFTKLIRFGDTFAGSRLPAIRALPLASVPGAGYDGQFYAQLAVSPDVRQAEVQTALDNPAYRARRIGLSLLAQLLGCGSPWLTLQIFALLNTAAWLIFAWLSWREIGDSTPQATLRWCAVVLGLGALDSLRLSLTDLPATLLVLLAARQASQKRPSGAVGWLMAASLFRETSILAFPLLWQGDRRAFASWLRFATTAAACAVPLVVWALWLHFSLPGNPGGAGNLLLPGQGLLHHLCECGRELAAGNFDSRYCWGLIGAVALGLQSISVLLRRRESNPWVRLALPFALLYWFLGPSVWHSYWTAARALLPLTLAFNLTLPFGRGYWWRFALGNACALHAIYRLLPDF